MVAPVSSQPLENARSVSTRIGWKPETITTAPQGREAWRSRRQTRPFLARRDWRRPLTITVAYRGSSEAWIEVKARGRTQRYDGHLTLLDVLIDIWDADEGVTDPR